MLAHAGNETGASLLEEWSRDPAILVGLALLVLLYSIGLWRSSGRRGRVLPWWRPWCFYTGWLVTFLALVSPMDALADDLFTMHMLQHLLLMLVAVPFMLLGAPIIPVLRGLPRSLRRGVVGPLARTQGVRRLVRFLTLPLVAWVAFTVSLVAWHVPAAYDAALEQTPVHFLQHLSFVLTSVFFWWVVIDPAPLRARLSYGLGILYMFVSAIPSTILGAMLTLAPEPWYAAYQGRAFWGLSAGEDQVIGGLSMWIPGGSVYVLTAAILFLMWFEREEGKRRITPRMSAEAEKLGEQS